MRQKRKSKLFKIINLHKGNAININKGSNSAKYLEEVQKFQKLVFFFKV